MNTKTVAIFVAVFALSTMLAFVSASESEATRNQYDFYLLAVEWTGSVCRVKDCSYNKEQSKTRFNLHGLWPSKDAKRHGPQECTHEALDYDHLPNELRDELEEYWNGLYHPTEQFLEHEWSKHGTCWSPQMKDIRGHGHSVVARLLSESRRRKGGRHHSHNNNNHNSEHSSEENKILESEPLTPASDADRKVYNEFSEPQLDENLSAREKYFKQVLSIAKYYDVYAMLAQEGVFPSTERSYSTDQIREALGRSMGIRDVVIRCEHFDGDLFLKEVRICLSLEYKPMNCPASVIRENNCHGPVLYPASLA
eukprot:TRINITY_DN1028_c0_g1_i1.p1 TRINITY_DN1028_c0_g1~~TRINITY_DN1028_c0_g1_i1.p1  ORF type:complete len:310 (+),score=64.23 TRINITY_DN1028_c0_g1_i1:201-1130(+)